MENLSRVFPASAGKTLSNDQPEEIPPHSSLTQQVSLAEEQGFWKFDKNRFWPDWNLNVNDSAQDPVVAYELNHRSVLPRDYLAISKLSDNEARKRYMVHKALHHAYEMDNIVRDNDIAAAHAAKYAAMSVLEEEWKEERAELKRKLAEAEEVTKQALAQNESLNAKFAEEKAALVKEVAQVKKFASDCQASMDAKIKQAAVDGVRGYQYSDRCAFDIRALNSLAYETGFNDCITETLEAFPNAGLSKEAMGFNEDIRDFDFWFNQYQCLGDVSEIWLDEDKAKAANLNKEDMVAEKQAEDAAGQEQAKEVAAELNTKGDQPEKSSGLNVEASQHSAT